MELSISDSIFTCCLVFLTGLVGQRLDLFIQPIRLTPYIWVLACRSSINLCWVEDCMVLEPCLRLLVPLLLPSHPSSKVLPSLFPSSFSLRSEFILWISPAYLHSEFHKGLYIDNESSSKIQLKVTYILL